MRIGDKQIGRGQPCYVVAEIGINHNGDMELCRDLINAAAVAGADAVKFQKRTVDVVYSPEELARPRESQFGDTNGDLKRGLEFGREQYDEIAKLCESLDLHWTASCWDVGSVKFIERYGVPYHKVAAACVTDHDLLRRLAATCAPVMLSCGMSTAQEVSDAIGVIGSPGVLLHCVSCYPTKPENVCLRTMQHLGRIARHKWLVGYSGHEMGTAISVAAVAMGACVVERHLTISRDLPGSDHKASLEPDEFAAMVRGIREVEAALAGLGERQRYECERPAWEKLRRVKGGTENCDPGEGA